MALRPLLSLAFSEQVVRGIFFSRQHPSLDVQVQMVNTLVHEIDATQLPVILGGLHPFDFELHRVCNHNMVDHHLTFIVALAHD